MASSRENDASTNAMLTARDQLLDQCLSAWREAGLTWKPRARWFPRLPAHLDAVFGQLFEPADGGNLDVIVFADERRSSPLHNLRDVVGGLQVPIVDIKGRAGDFADAQFDIMDPRSWTETARRIVKFRQGREKVAHQHRQTANAEIEVLAHVFVSGRQIRGMRYPLTPEAICYPGFFSAGRIIPLAEGLVSRGFLKRTFFDRLHECGTCRSRRLSVREECPSCRSADLRETSLVHHFHCAAVLPEQEFKQGFALVCPKCRRQLRNYGKDYDRPGQAYVCNACENTSSELEVGFICLDCNARMDGEAAERIDLYSYSITDAGMAFLETPVPLQLGGLPPALAHELARMRHAGRDDIAVAEIRFGRREALVQAKGQPTFDRSRELFIENFRNRLSDAGSHHVVDGRDYLLINRLDAVAEKEIQSLLHRSDEVLRDHLDARLVVLERFKQVSN